MRAGQQGLKALAAALKRNKNLCGRDGRTICGPLRVPKITYVTLAHKRKPKFFYFGCSLVRRFYCKIKKLHPIITGRTDRRTDRQTDRQSATQYAAPWEEGRIIKRNLKNEYKFATHSQLTWNEVQHKLDKVLGKINQSDRSLKSGYFMLSTRLLLNPVVLVPRTGKKYMPSSQTLES